MANDTSLYNKFGRTIRPGDIIFNEGDTGNEMFIIQNGKVRISKINYNILTSDFGGFDSF